MSTEARKVYGDLQETLNQVSEKHRSGTISEEHYEMVRENCSKLRTELTKDLLSRRRAFLVS